MEPGADDRAGRALFISRAGADADFAAVVGSILEAAGHSVILQQWDFANRNFVERMHAALTNGARVVALLSPEYLRSDHCQAEWQNAIADDPLNTRSRLILLRVVECEPAGLLRGLAYWDLVGIRDDRALLDQIVRDAVCEERLQSATTGPYWRAPRTIIDTEAVRPVPSFSGRDEELAAISAALARDGSVAAIHGLGGVGKSSIAREYCWRARDRYSVVWWLNAESDAGIVEALLRLGILLARGLDHVADRRHAAQQVTSSMLSGFAKPVLLVFDNLDDERLLRAWQPRTGARVLITSRNASWSSNVAAIDIETWPSETGVAYLRRESGRPDLTDADARAIVRALGALPLALSHVAASLRGMRMVTPQRYLERINDRLRLAPRDVEYPSSVFATFGASIAQAEQQAAGAASVLCFAAMFGADAIPDELFYRATDLCPEGLKPVLAGVATLDLRSALSDEVVLDGALAALDRLALLTFTEVSRTYSMHRLVRIAARDLIAAARPAWCEFAIAVAEAAFPMAEFRAWSQCERLLPHARAALNGLASDTGLLSAASLAHRCAAYLRDRGEYEAAESLHSRALAIREKSLGPDHPDVARNLNNLALVYWDRGRYADAEPLYMRALAIWENTLGADHPNVAQSLNNLAIMYRDQGRYAEVEALHTRSLAIFEKALGPDDPNVALSLDNLGVVYRDIGRHADAIPLHARALAIFEKALGPEHPSVAYSMSNLGNAYREQGRYAEAQPLLTRALATLEAALGPERPDVAQSLNNLAKLFARQGRLADAESLLNRALGIWESAGESDHPAVAEGLSSLASVYLDQGRGAEARSLYARALELRERVLTPEHPLTRATRASLDALQ
jgi:tetratricopeptide (TPR) repeat protein